MPTLPDLPLRPVSPIRPPEDGDQLMTVSVSAEGELLALWRTSAPPSLAGLRRRPVEVRVSVHRPGGVTVLTIPSMPLTNPTVQLLPGGRVLLASSECRWTPETPIERNAAVYDAQGDVESEETLGADIFHLQADLDGAVWVGYGATSVWGDSCLGPEAAPLEAPGLVRFSPIDMRPVWGYPFDLEWGPIVYCDALNVDDYATWMMYGTPGPVIRISGGTISGWRTQVSGFVSALAVSYPRVALFSSPRRLLVGTLEDGRFHVTGRYRIVLPGGEPLESGHVYGRGATLHTVIDGTWYQLTLTGSDGVPS